MHRKTNLDKDLACMDVYGDEVFWDCDSGCRGFESHRSPQFINALRVVIHAINKVPVH